VNVEIELFGQLLPGVQRKQTLALVRSMNVQEVATLLGLNPKEIGLITINNAQSELDDPVLPDCRLCFFPPMSGG
jgi:molybdopterin converting factor small subunit